MTASQSRGRTLGLALRGLAALPVLLALALPACNRREHSAPAEPEQAATASATSGPTQGDPSLSHDAKPETFEMLREDLEAVRNPADGGGRAWLEVFSGSDADSATGAPAGTALHGEAGGRRRIPAGSRQRFPIVFEAGPLGIAPGGMIFLQVSPFWEWDWPQTHFPDGPGYTEVTTRAEGIELEPVSLSKELLAIRIDGRALEAGERVHIDYGAGATGARVDRYAEHDTHLWIAVTLPSTAQVGDSVRLVVAVLDGWGNAGVPFEGKIEFLDRPPGLELPEHVALRAEDEGHKTLLGSVSAPGLYRLRARASSALGDVVFESNPLLVRDDLPQILWGDLHGHSNYSDGTGTPEDYYRYARDVAGLDVAALTDHDHWGMRFLDTSPELWEEIRQTAKRFHEPGRFVTLLGYEWTSWLHGHRHVLYFADEGQVLSSVDPNYQTPSQLWRALDGQPALTFAHHSAGGPISTNWRYPPDSKLEPITEIANVHGSSEALDSPGAIYNPSPTRQLRARRARPRLPLRLHRERRQPRRPPRPDPAGLRRWQRRFGGHHGRHPRPARRPPGPAIPPHLRHQRPAHLPARADRRPRDGLTVATGRGRSHTRRGKRRGARQPAARVRSGGNRAHRAHRLRAQRPHRERPGRGPESAVRRANHPPSAARRVRLSARSPRRRRRRLVEPHLRGLTRASSGDRPLHAQDKPPQVAPQPQLSPGRSQTR